jgi:hypothetical protein
MELRIATCRPLPEPDPDEELLLAALAARDVRAAHGRLARRERALGRGPSRR